MSLKDLLIDETNITKTENNAKAFHSTKNAILDLFGIGGAARNLDDNTLYVKISQALAQDLELGIRCLLYLSDVRGGQGERRLFKIGLKVIADTQPKKLVERVLESVPFFGRWDYLLDFLVHKTYDKTVLDIIKKEVEKGELSLIYKWLPTLQLHTKKALIVAEYLGLSKKEYRKLLSEKRRELKVVERLMSDKMWDQIDYPRVPSKASMIYRKAFEKHDKERYQAFIDSVIKGEQTINAKTLYPHELMSKIKYNPDSTLEAQWKNLPNFLKDEGRNVLPMIDVSGSMDSFISPKSNVTAMDVSVGLGIYLAERITGELKDYYLSFSNNPRMVKVTGDSLYQKAYNVRHTDIGYNTNVIKAFGTILKVAVENKLEQKDLPTHILLISDMEFDSATHNDQTPFEEIERLFGMHDFKLPQVVFWNVNARNVQFPVTQNKLGVTLVSGYSPSILQYILGEELKTPYETMLDVLNKERYNIFD